MQDSYIYIPLSKGATEKCPAPISGFASSNPEAFEGFLRHPALKKVEWQKDAFQIFKIGSIETGWCLVPLQEDFIRYTVDPLANMGDASPKGSSLKQREKDLILETLRMCGGKKARAARILGITRRTIYRKLKEWE